MTAHRGQRPRGADPVDGDLRLSKSLADRRCVYAATPGNQSKSDWRSAGRLSTDGSPKTTQNPQTRRSTLLVIRRPLVPAKQLPQFLFEEEAGPVGALDVIQPLG